MKFSLLRIPVRIEVGRGDSARRGCSRDVRAAARGEVRAEYWRHPERVED